MGFGVSHPYLTLFRSVKAGESGLNLRLSDLLDKEVEIPSLYEIVKTFFTRRKIRIKIKAYPNKVMERLYAVQRGVDRRIEEEIRKAQSGI